MIIHFKRFKSRGYWNEKLNSLVDFPLTDFDMSPFTLSSKEPQIYDLYGVSNHYGGLGGGHYTAYVYSNFLDSWIEMDDTRVRKISPKKVVSSSAYILFYKRRDS